MVNYPCYGGVWHVWFIPNNVSYTLTLIVVHLLTWQAPQVLQNLSSLLSYPEHNNLNKNTKTTNHTMYNNPLIQQGVQLNRQINTTYLFFLYLVEFDWLEYPLTKILYPHLWRQAAADRRWNLNPVGIQQQYSTINRS